jgi:hypothetical protein
MMVAPKNDIVSRLIDKTAFMLQRLYNLKSQQTAPSSTSNSRHYTRATTATTPSPELEAELNKITDALDAVSLQIDQLESRLTTTVLPTPPTNNDPSGSSANITYEKASTKKRGQALAKNSETRTKKSTWTEDIAPRTTERLVSLATPTFECTLERVQQDTVAVLEEYSLKPEVQKAGMCCLRLTDFERGDSSNILIPSIELITGGEETGLCAAVTMESCMEEGAYTTRTIMASEAATLDQYTEPSFSNPTRGHEQLSDDALEALFEFSKDHVSAQSFYLIGPPEDMGVSYTTKLSAGKWMNQCLADVHGGINSSYLYVSAAAGKRTATNLHIEDCVWPSVNMMLAGQPKAWLCVEPEDHLKLRDSLQKHFKHRGRCGQAVRHMGVVISPRMLKQWGIRYHIQLCQPGELIFTMPNAYHQIVNLGDNVAEAVNFMFSTTESYPLNYKFCKRGICVAETEAPIAPEHFRIIQNEEDRALKRTAEVSQDKPSSSKRQRLDKTALAEMQGLSLKGFTIDQGKIDDDRGVKLAASVASWQTFDRVIALIRAWRMEPSLRLSMADPGASEHWIDKVVTLHRSIERSQYKTLLPLLQVRLDEYAFAVEAERTLDGRKVSHSDFIDNIIKRMGVLSDQTSRNRVIDGVSHRKKWLRICQHFGVGLLLLIPLKATAPLRIGQDFCHKITKSEVLSFHTALERTSVYAQILELATMAKKVLETMTSKTNQIFEFQYEFSPTKPKAGLFGEFTGMGIDRALELFTKTQYLENNKCPTLSELQKWRKPPGWYEDEIYHWPKDPMSIPASTPCDVCNKTEGCGCMSMMPQNHVRITEFDLNDRGLQALRTFEKDTDLGELTGQIVPFDAGADAGSTFIVTRPGRDACVCRISTQNFGNWVRLARQSPNANAAIVPMFRAGRLRMMLRSMCEIAAGVEITISL